MFGGEDSAIGGRRRLGGVFASEDSVVFRAKIGWRMEGRGEESASVRGR